MNFKCYKELVQDLFIYSVRWLRGACANYIKLLKKTVNYVFI